ncbi:MAG TPA: alpha/beta hydrolase [Bacilli bacterium]|jgi:pimeloyl-ACP methyl ester carboxylesterase|nr:alpha/beta hydrolase [Bacilli bacterium]HQM07526.1 alpha/beta hydrolase [Bacilli bacterium]
MLKHIEITNKEGRILRGYLTLPEEFNGDLVLMYHGFTGNKTEHAGHFRNLSRLLAAEKIASLRMDFSGNGESDGEFSDFTFDTLIAEANLMLDYAKTISDVKRVMLLGFSMGGAVAAMVAAKRYQEIDKMVLWSPAGNILEKIKKAFESGIKLENGNVMMGTFELSKAMVESVNRYDVYQGIENFKKPVLIIHGRKDLAVNYLISAIYSVRFFNSHLFYLNEAGHGYDSLTDREELYQRTLEFLKTR